MASAMAMAGPLPVLKQRDAARVHFRALRRPRVCIPRASAVRDLPPSSRDEALLQARVSLWGVLDKPLKRLEPASIRKLSNSKSRRQARFRIEIPLLDESDEALVSLMFDLLGDGLALGGNAFKACVVFEGGFLQGLAARRLEDDCRAPISQLANLEDGGRIHIEQDSAFVLVLAPGSSQIAAVAELVASAGNRAVVVVNPQWSEEEEQDLSFCKSFEVAYSFTPLSIQGFFSNIEGAVLKHVTSGAPAGTPWRIFVKEGNEKRQSCVLSLNRRPSAKDLENALYDSVAANSPIVKSVKFLRGLVGRKG